MVALETGLGSGGSTDLTTPYCLRLPTRLTSASRSFLWALEPAKPSLVHGTSPHTPTSILLPHRLMIPMYPQTQNLVGDPGPGHLTTCL